MNDKELDKAKQGLYAIPNWRDNPALLSKDKEFSCISMINSILCYSGARDTAELTLQAQEQSTHNYLRDYVKLLGTQRVVQLIKEQMGSIERIECDVHCDSEGCTYNSIIWKN